MPKRSTKSKSKRLSLRQKHKILRKVKEHHKKKRKEANRAVRDGKKAPKPKDPGIPSQWPFKEELIKELAWQKSQILFAEKSKKEERKRARQDAMAEDGEEGDAELAALQHSASRKQDDFETRKRARITSDVDGDKDHSMKAFYREFKKVVELADVVIQVLDARDPLACRCPDVERYIRSVNPNKRIILLLNKMDLVPREVGEKWLKHFREELPCVAFKCSTQQQAANIGHKRMPAAKGAADALGGSACLGADTLLQLLKNYTRNANIKTAITVGVIGLPNVGKSSLINSLKRTRAAQVGNTPGVTKAVQEVVLDSKIKLLDSPGIVFTNAENDAAAALRNCVKIEKLEDPISPIAEVLKRVPAKALMALYKIAAFSDADEMLAHIAAARGKLRRGGTPDLRAAARIVLQDWNDGRIPYYTLPPARNSDIKGESQVVATWAADFNADEVFANEASAVIAHLPSLDDDGGRDYFETGTAGPADVTLAAMEAGSSSGSESDGMEDDGDDGGLPAASAGVRAKLNGAHQTEALYNEDGQFNPKAARAQKKRAKRAKAAAPAGEGGDDDDSDFDFNADGDSGSDGESGSDEGSGSGSGSEDGMEGSDVEE